MQELTIGMIVEGVVTGIQTYGAFVLIDNNKTGLIHISEISHSFISDIRDFINIGDHLQLKIIDIDKENDQIRLSLKALQTNNRKERVKRQRRPLVMKIGFKTIEDTLPIWIEEATKEIKHDKS